MVWYGGDPSSPGRKPRSDAGNLAGMYGRHDRRPPRPKMPRPGARPPPRGRKTPKRTRVKKGRKSDPKKKGVVSSAKRKIGKTAAEIRGEVISNKASLKPKTTAPPPPRPKVTADPFVTQSKKAREFVLSKGRSKVKTGQKRLKEVKKEQKAASNVRRQLMDKQKKLMAMQKGPLPTQLKKVQQQKLVSQAPVPMKKKPSSPRLAQQSKIKSMIKKGASKAASTVPSVRSRGPMKKPDMRQKMKAALKSKGAPTKQTPENYQDLIKSTGTKAPTKPSMRLDVMEKKRKAMESKIRRKGPSKSPDYMQVIKKEGTARAATPLEQMKQERKITKINAKKRAKQARTAPIKPFIHADKKVETKVDPKTKAITLQKKVRGKVVKQKSFTPKKIKQAIATREKMKEEVVKETKVESEKPLKKVVRNVIVTLEVSEKKDPVSKALGFFESLGSRWIVKGHGKPVKTGGHHMTPRQQRINAMFAGNTEGWY